MRSATSPTGLMTRAMVASWSPERVAPHTSVAADTIRTVRLRGGLKRRVRTCWRIDAELVRCPAG
jgi:hypothetical protein